MDGLDVLTLAVTGVDTARRFHPPGEIRNDPGWFAPDGAVQSRERS